MKFYVAKYALIKGIFEIEGRLCNKQFVVETSPS